MPRQDSQRLRWAIFLLTVPVIVAADQITKAWIRTYPEGSVIFQSGILRIVHISNSGAAFGLFRGWSAALLVIDFAALVLIVLYLLRLHNRFKLFSGVAGWIALSLVFSGTCGNLIDRLNFSIAGITDFVYIWIWPAFNVADSAITVGVVLLAAVILFNKEKVEA